MTAWIEPKTSTNAMNAFAFTVMQLCTSTKLMMEVSWPDPRLLSFTENQVNLPLLQVFDAHSIIMRLIATYHSREVFHGNTNTSLI